MINFNKPPYIGKEMEYIAQVIEDNQQLCGNGPFSRKCSEWFEKTFNSPKALLTTSCTHSLEMAAILIDINPGDEIIVPSFTFVSTVNPFVMRGARIVFIDIRPDTMNMDERLIEAAISEKTKAIVPVHYAGVSCEMDKIIEIARRYDLYVIEDAAHGVMSTYNGKALGSIGDIGCYSFHETKNYSMGEGGAILIQNKKFIERAEIIREKGTDRAKFFRGQVDKYSWVDIGSSYIPSEINAAHLFAQLEAARKINNNRLNSWNLYKAELEELESEHIIELPRLPDKCMHNAHMFFIKCRDLHVRTKLIQHLRNNNILAVFHYVPLHSSDAGKKYGSFYGNDIYTTSESERLLRLPMYYGLDTNQIKFVTKKIYEFFQGRSNY